jgi:hypothetical protein
MPDIEKCTNADCPLSEKCWRYMSIPSIYQQAYNKFEPTVTEDEVDCEMYLKMEIFTPRQS